MSDDSPLIVTPAGTTLVATDALLATLDRLHTLVSRLEHERQAVAQVLALQDWVEVPGVSPWARDASWRMRSAESTLRIARDRAAWLAVALRAAVDAYDRVDAEAQSLIRLNGAVVAWVFGTLAGVGLLAPRVALAIAGLAGVKDGALSGVVPTDGDGAGDLGTWLQEHPEVVTSTEFVNAVRLLASSSDDAAEGFEGVPLPLSVLLGDDELGVTGVAAGAAWQIWAGHQAGVLEETPTTATLQSTTTGGAPAAGTAQRLDRVPRGGEVRVERYELPGSAPRYVVYVGPTDTFAITHTDVAEDETSNHYGVAGLPSGSLRATEDAMRQAGIRPGDQVQVVGYSQGGLIASRVAASGDWNVVSMETFGGPTGNVALPDRVHGIAIRNTDDFVPALGGQQLDHHLVQVERQAYPDAAAMPHVLVPAHQRDAYHATALAVDAAGSDAVRAATASLDAFAGDYSSQGATITTTVYSLTRIDEEAKGAGGAGARAVAE